MTGMNQQPPMHQFKMRPFKPFWGWIKNTSSSPAQGFFSPLLYPKVFPSYLLPRCPPTYLPLPTSFTSFPTHSISRAQESSWTWLAQSFEKTWYTRLEEGGEFNIEGVWRGESNRSASSQMHKREKKGNLLPFSAFFFSLWFFFLCVFLSFLLLKKKKMPRRKRLKQKGKNKRPKVRGQSKSLKVSSLPSLFFCSSLWFFLFFSSTWEE